MSGLASGEGRLNRLLCFGVVNTLGGSSADEGAWPELRLK